MPVTSSPARRIVPRLVALVLVAIPLRLRLGLVCGRRSRLDDGRSHGRDGRRGGHHRRFGGQRQLRCLGLLGNRIRRIQLERGGGIPDAAHVAAIDGLGLALKLRGRIRQGS